MDNTAIGLVTGTGAGAGVGASAGAGANGVVTATMPVLLDGQSQLFLRYGTRQQAARTTGLALL